VEFEDLFEDFPDEFTEYMNYCRSLKFEQKPDYEYLKGLFVNLLARHGDTQQDSDFDWVIKREELIREHCPEKFEEYTGKKDPLLV
jgi:hypothetical protein